VFGGISPNPRSRPPPRTATAVVASAIGRQSAHRQQRPSLFQKKQKEQISIMGSSSSLHSEVCNVHGASDTVFHGSISHDTVSAVYKSYTQVIIAVLYSTCYGYEALPADRHRRHRACLHLATSSPWLRLRLSFFRDVLLPHNLGAWCAGLAEEMEMRIRTTTTSSTCRRRS
jgi:hypothetical protein